MRKTLLDRQHLATPSAVTSLLDHVVGHDEYAPDSLRMVAHRMLAEEPEATQAWAADARAILTRMVEVISGWAEDGAVPPTALRAGAKWIAHSRAQLRRLSRFMTTGEGGCGLFVAQVEDCIKWGAALCSRAHSGSVDESLASQAECARRRLLDIGLTTDAAIVALDEVWVSFLTLGPADGAYNADAGFCVVSRAATEAHRMSVSPTVIHELVHSCSPPAKSHRSPYIARAEGVFDEAIVECVTRYIAQRGTHGFIADRRPQWMPETWGHYSWFVRVIESMPLFRDASESDRVKLLAECVKQGEGARCAWLAARAGIEEVDAAEDLQAMLLVSPLR